MDSVECLPRLYAVPDPVDLFVFQLQDKRICLAAQDKNKSIDAFNFESYAPLAANHPIPFQAFHPGVVDDLHLEAGHPLQQQFARAQFHVPGYIR